MPPGIQGVVSQIDEVARGDVLLRMRLADRRDACHCDKWESATNEGAYSGKPILRKNAPYLLGLRGGEIPRGEIMLGPAVS